MRSWRSTATSVALVAGLLALSMSLTPLAGCGGGAPGPGEAGLTVSPTSLAFVASDTSKTLTIDGGVADAWTCTAADPWLTLSPSSGTGSAQVLVSVNRTGLDGGLHTSSVVIAGAGGSVTVTVSVDNRMNAPPTISSLTADPSSVRLGGTITFTAEAFDPDGDTLTYSWNATGGSISGSGETVSWKAPSSVGTYTVACSVSDGYGGADSRAATLTVTPNIGGYDITIQ